MLLPLSWLKQFVTVDESAEQVAERFVNLGFEAEGIDGDIIDLDITPNRGDVLSIYGLAREYAASTNQSLSLPPLTKLQTAPALDGFTITAEPAAYHRISATIIRNISVGPSPDWLKETLEQAGMNSINNIVDITNYAMLELGIPNHAFDLDRLPAPELHMELSTQDEPFITLSDEQVIIPAGSIMVRSNGQLIENTGIRGGKSTMITDRTKNILLWAVCVPRPLVRRTSKLSGIRTEGSYRHERETDWEMAPTILERLVYLIQSIAGGTVSNAIDLEASPRETKCISVTAHEVNNLLGTNLSETEVQGYLERLGFVLDDGKYTVPSWRYFDINFPEDLIEEVARMHGYNQLPRNVIVPVTRTSDPQFMKIEHIKDMLVAAGWTEAYTESFSGTAETKLRTAKTTELATLANPVNRDFAFCRPEVIPNLIKLLALNSWSDDAKVFEIGNAFPGSNTEETHLTLAAYGKNKADLAMFVPEEAIEMIAIDHPLAKLFKLRRPAIVAEVPIGQVRIDTASSDLATPAKPTYRKVSSLPPAARDISIIVNQLVDPESIIQDIYDTAPEHIVLTELFDQFSSDKFGPNKQSLAFHVIYQSMDKTLDTETVDQLHEHVTQALIEKYGATLR